MRVWRRGSRANHGFRSIEIPKLAVRWDGKRRTIDVCSEGPIKDFATSARHDYFFEFNKEDIGKLILGIDKCMAQMGQDEFKETFESLTPALLRILNAGSGVWFPSAEAKE